MAGKANLPLPAEGGAVTKADSVKAPGVTTTRSRKERDLPETVGNGRFVLEKKLGEGSFGMVYRGFDKKENRQVAIKLEHQKTSAVGQLGNESRLMDQLSRPVRPAGFAELMFFAKEGLYAVMVMDLLGMTLEDSVQACGGQMRPSSAALVAEQGIHLLSYVHSKSIVHRDIKSENFMWGTGDKVHHLYAIDFGMSTRYFIKKHVQMQTGKQLTGTARYASINAMMGRTQSRRDDLEALGHMLMYSLRGHLPWSGLDAPTYRDKLKLICEKKQNLPLDELCHGYPKEFQSFLHYSRTLQFDERPEYDKMVQMFGSYRASQDPPVQEFNLQWLEGKDIDTSTLVSLELDKPCPIQPDS